MSKYSICVIGVYFGKLPAYFNLWLKSCEYNPDIDFLVITDDESDENVFPQNVRKIKMTLNEMKALADEKLGLNTALVTPYKCCDFKVVYGNIFADYLNDYDFWGHCDFDLIFGDIRHFITDDILQKNDKIFDLGHLAIYRNTDKVKEYYKLPGGRHDYIKVFTSAVSYAFDERNCIYQIYKTNNLPMFDKIIYLDIYSIYTRFKVVHGIKNYKHQVFYWENGKVFRAYKNKKSIFYDEFVYIHFKKRGFSDTINKPISKFYISVNGFSSKESSGVPSLKEMNKINPFVFKKEFSEILNNVFRLFMRKVKGVLRRVSNILTR